VLGDLIKRIFNLAVLGLAALAFFLVPVGRKTPAQHVVAIFRTTPAREAAREFSEAARRVVGQVRAELSDTKGDGAKSEPGGRANGNGGN
jgi:hypothetical protein